MRREKNQSCRAFRREKNILPTRLLEKKILNDQKSTTLPPPPPGEEGAITKFYTVRHSPEVQPLNLLILYKRI